MNAPGFWELVALIVLALLIFGPDKLPGLARHLGQLVRAEAASTLDELKRAAEYEEFKSVAGELKATSADVRRTMAAGGAAATGGAHAAAAGRAGADVVRTEPAPFDPDAT